MKKAAIAVVFLSLVAGANAGVLKVSAKEGKKAASKASSAVHAVLGFAKKILY